MSDKPKAFPVFKSDEEAEAFVASADLTEYDFTHFAPARFEFAGKDARLNMRLPSALLAAVKAKAARSGMPYQRYIRRTLERALET